MIVVRRRVGAAHLLARGVIARRRLGAAHFMMRRGVARRRRVRAARFSRPSWIAWRFAPLEVRTRGRIITPRSVIGSPLIARRRYVMRRRAAVFFGPLVHAVMRKAVHIL